MRVPIWKLIFWKQPIEAEEDDDVALAIKAAIREVQKAHSELDKTMDALLENNQRLRVQRGKAHLHPPH
jgi:hypothetical protein